MFNHPANSTSYRLLQITDSHLGARPGHSLLGMDTDESLSRVVKAARLAASNVDLLLATGDIADDGSIAAYQRFQSMVSHFDFPSVWLCGNHDDLANLGDVCGQAAGSTGRRLMGNWQIIFLNSAIPGKVGGTLGEDQLAFLNECLTAQPEKFAFICLHHQPVDIGCEWLDKQKVNNADAFFSILDRHSNVRAVLWGHVHQQFDQQRNEVALMASPSSCIQFAANSDEFAVDHAAPGYRIIDLHEDGSLTTEVQRIDASGLSVDYAATGY